MWRLQEKQAHLQTALVSATVDFLRPWTGLQNLQLQHRPLDRLQLLQVHTQPPGGQGEEVVIDRYVRGEDLVVSYAQTPGRTTRPQIYWRRLQLADVSAEGVELIVSTQTSRLHSDPTLTMASELPADQVWRPSGQGADFKPIDLPVDGSPAIELKGGPGLFLFRLPAEPWSYAEMVYPGDFQAARLAVQGGRVQLSYRLFEAEPLEKGVIRRARVWGLFVPRQRDQERAWGCYEQLLASAPPLTV